MATRNTLSKRKEEEMAYPKDLSSSSSSANFALVKCSSGRKRCRDEIQKKQLPPANSAASKFMSIVPDHLLVEIFLRFPTSRSVMRCAAVCKRWCSLVIDTCSRKFIRTFIQYHLRKQSLDSLDDPPCTSAITFNYSRFNYGPFYHICSEEPKPKPYDISFMPNWEELTIRTASGDLLLLSRSTRQFFVCNWLTRQWWLALPEVPPVNKFARDKRVFDEDAFGAFGFAIVRDPVDDDDRHSRYKVVLIYRCCFELDDYSFFAAIFDSEFGLWTVIKRFFVPFKAGVSYGANMTGLQIAIASNGLLHWLDGIETRGALFVFDPFSLKPRFVRVPGGVELCFFQLEVRLGVVRGRVRLSLMRLADKPYGLKVWELDSDSYTWLLVHDFDFGMSADGDGDGDGDGGLFFMLAFDPHDGNVLFLVRGEHVFRYEVEQDKYEKICEFPCNGEPIYLKKESIGAFLIVSTLMHPLWPTLSLPST